jgi:hypothetical protein
MFCPRFKIKSIKNFVYNKLKSLQKQGIHVNMSRRLSKRYTVLSSGRSATQRDLNFFRALLEKSCGIGA